MRPVSGVPSVYDTPDTFVQVRRQCCGGHTKVARKQARTQWLRAAQVQVQVVVVAVGCEEVYVCVACSRHWALRKSCASLLKTVALNTHTLSRFLSME